jgi:hypothetical protein
MAEPTPGGDATGGVSLGKGAWDCDNNCEIPPEKEVRCPHLPQLLSQLEAWHDMQFTVCVVMWGGRSFGLHTSKVRAKDRGHTYSLHRTHMGCLTWTVRVHVL